jgi:Protein of unknown function (DUF3551)
MCRIAVVAVIFALLLPDVGHAAPWCAHYGFRTNCGFYSFEQCMATVSGNAGFCSRNQFENPNWTGGEARRRNRRDY